MCRNVSFLARLVFSLVEISHSKPNLGFPMWNNLFHRGECEAISCSKDKVCFQLKGSILPGGTLAHTDCFVRSVLLLCQIVAVAVVIQCFYEALSAQIHLRGIKEYYHTKWQKCSNLQVSNLALSWDETLWAFHLKRWVNSTGSKIAPSWSPLCVAKNWVLGTRISHLVTSGWLTLPQLTMMLIESSRHFAKVS